MAKFLRASVLLLSLALLAAAMPATAYGANGAYDTDGDGLIEISYLEQLDAVRSDLNGDGTPGDPPQGYGKGADTALWFAAFPNVQGESACPNPCTGYELTRDLDFNDPGSYASGRVNPEWTSGGGWEPMVFGATFEGNGHTISNLYSNRPFHRASISTYRKKGGGLFEQLWGASTQRHDVDGIIANLGLVNVNITGENSAYALVGYNNGIIRNSYATGRVSANGLVGGLVAANSKGGRIIDSYADVDLETYGGSTFGSAGGLVGDNRGLIRGSHAQGDVMGLEAGVGGLVGTNGALGRLDPDKQTVYGTIESSYATGSVTGVSRSSDKVDVGGLVGYNEGIINRSYATGPVFAPTDHAGGLVGTNSGRITASYASGDVWAENHVGGLVGSAGGVIAGSYATGEVHGVGDLGGLVGRLGGGKIIGSYSTGPVVQVAFGQSDNDFVLAFGDYGSLVGSLSSSSEIVASYATGPISGGIAKGGRPFDSSHPEAPENVRYSYWSSGARGPHLLANEERTAKLQSPVAYEGIYANWREDVDNADGDGNPATGGDDVWDFGDGSQYPALKADLDGDGRATWQEFGDQPRDRPADASPPTTFSPSAWPERPYLEFALPAPNGRYDQDGDGLIEVNYLEQLDAIRHDLDGNGVPNYTANTREGIDPSNNWEEITSRHIDGQAYAAAFPTATGEPVCRQRCHGYELARSLDFNDPASYASGAVNPAWTAGEGWASLGYYRHNYSSGFLAIFEGNGFTINNLYIGDSRLKVSELFSTTMDVRTDSYLPRGLIGYAGPTAQVRNLGLVDASIRETTFGFGSLGALVTVNEGIIGDCYATGSLQVAMPPDQDFDDELLHLSLSGTGGLVGVNQHAGEIRNSYATVTSSTVPKVRSLYERPTIRMGGLVGLNAAFIRDSYATGDVSTLDLSSGGLGVDNTGIVLRSHATGNVSVEPGFRGPEALAGFPAAGGGGLFAVNKV